MENLSLSETLALQKYLFAFSLCVLIFVPLVGVYRRVSVAKMYSVAVLAYISVEVLTLVADLFTSNMGLGWAARSFFYKFISLDGVFPQVLMFAVLGGLIFSLKKLQRLRFQRVFEVLFWGIYVSLLAPRAVSVWGSFSIDDTRFDDQVTEFLPSMMPEDIQLMGRVSETAKYSLLVLFASLAVFLIAFVVSLIWGKTMRAETD